MAANSNALYREFRAAYVLPITRRTLVTLESRLFLELGIPPVNPGELAPKPFLGLLRDAIVRPLHENLGFLEMDPSGHVLVARNAPWNDLDIPPPSVPEGMVPMFEVPAGWIVGSLLFRYLVVLTDNSTNAHRSYKRAGLGRSLVVDIDVAQATIQIYLPRLVAMAMGHAVATHFLLGKSVPARPLRESVTV